jgi:micrococcal nuclease
MHTIVGSLAVLALVTTLLTGTTDAQPVAGPAYVTRVVDADTVYAEVGGRLEVVRYLGVNAPHIEHPALGTERYSLAAREANRRLVEGKWIRLVFEGPSRDRDGRLIAYVWVGDVFVNAMLVHRGYAEAAAESRAGYAAYFVSLQEGAQRDGRGLWREGSAQTYHRPRATEVAADEGRADATGGRVFSAPAPFVPTSSSSSYTFIPSSSSPSSTSTSSTPSSVGSGSSSGFPSSIGPRGSTRR